MDDTTHRTTHRRAPSPGGTGSGTEPSWGIAEAKQRFSEVVRAAEEEPQMIYNRDRRVAAVVGGGLLESFLAWRQRQGRSLAAAFGELRELAAQEDFVLEVPPRHDRDNPFAD